jgi:transposase
MIEFTEKERKFLENHKSIKRLTEKQVSFTSQFKLESVQKYFKGISPRLIFEEAGFSKFLFPTKYVNGCLKRWKNQYNQDGEEGLDSQKRGRPKKQSTSDLLDHKHLLERLAYLEEENDFLKKRMALKRKKTNSN